MRGLHNLFGLFRFTKEPQLNRNRTGRMAGSMDKLIAVAAAAAATAYRTERERQQSHRVTTAHTAMSETTTQRADKHAASSCLQVVHQPDGSITITRSTTRVDRAAGAGSAQYGADASGGCIGEAGDVGHRSQRMASTAACLSATRRLAHQCCTAREARTSRRSRR